MQFGYLAGASAIQSSRRRWLTTVMAFLLVTGLVLIAPPAGADFEPDTSLEVNITSPADGAYVEDSEDVFLTGSASIGEGDADPDTTVVYILDVSGSTRNSAGVDCDGESGNDSILVCEKEAVRKVNADAESASSPVLNSGLGVFAGSGTVITPTLVAPGDPIHNALTDPRVTSGGQTNFGAGLLAANTILTGSVAPGDTKIVIFLTDGNGSGTFELPEGTIVKAFAIAGAGCTDNLKAISEDVGGSCEVVSNLSQLDGVIGEAIGSTVDTLAYSVDGFVKDLPTDKDLPDPGPVTFNEDIGPLPLGPHTICVQATGTEAGEPVSTEECVDIEVVQDVVDCAVEEECVAAANDGDVSDATVVGKNFLKTLGIRPSPTAPGECGGDDCVTGYDVLFPGAGGDGYVELTVVSSRENSTPPGQAAVFITGDDLVLREITDKCHKNADKSLIPCVKIKRIKGGLTQYFVRVNADPHFSFR